MRLIFVIVNPIANEGYCLEVFKISSIHKNMKIYKMHSKDFN